MPPIDEIDRRTDVVFLLFHHANEVHGVTKVQKLLFLVEQETEFFQEYEEDIAFNFAPYKMGPFSENVYTELEFLLSMGAISSHPMDEPEISMTDSELRQKTFQITPKGEKIATQLSNQLEPEYDDELRDLVETYNDLPLRELLRYVYQTYPNFAVESEIITELGLDSSLATSQ
ncbi:DUF4065 domain-containing protein [Halorubrum ezzemoulense]|uniref:DUF4065 domain-containing protein n=1 Tax=Halorubrum ezzemoulense TaxID=337243 RepID=A0A256JCJ4_HALEZ|nr:DUF4065 domain-containing protein [Halorubrum ezzemoulense]OYR66490.1 DUF4065 domain-containing protein [Halorubrum ezzemoulense]